MKPVKRARGQSRDSPIFRLASGNICNRSEILQARSCLLNQSEVFQLKKIFNQKRLTGQSLIFTSCQALETFFSLNFYYKI